MGILDSLSRFGLSILIGLIALIIVILGLEILISLFNKRHPWLDKLGKIDLILALLSSILFGIIGLYNFPIHEIWHQIYDMIQYFNNGALNADLVIVLGVLSLIFGIVFFIMFSRLVYEDEEDDSESPMSLEMTRFTFSFSLLVVLVAVSETNNYESVGWFLSLITRITSLPIMFISVFVIFNVYFLFHCILLRDSYYKKFLFILPYIGFIFCFILFSLIFADFMAKLVYAVIVIYFILALLRPTTSGGYIGSFNDRDGNKWDVFRK